MIRKIVLVAIIAGIVFHAQVALAQGGITFQQIVEALIKSGGTVQSKSILPQTDLTRPGKCQVVITLPQTEALTTGNPWAYIEKATGLSMFTFMGVGDASLMNDGLVHKIYLRTDASYCGGSGGGGGGLKIEAMPTLLLLLVSLFGILAGITLWKRSRIAVAVVLLMILATTRCGAVDVVELHAQTEGYEWILTGLPDDYSDYAVGPYSGNILLVTWGETNPETEPDPVIVELQAAGNSLSVLVSMNVDCVGLANNALAMNCAIGKSGDRIGVTAIPKK